MEQEFEVRPVEGRQEIEAKFQASKNQTVIDQKEPKPEITLVKPGLVLLRMAADKGNLVIEC